MAGKAGTFLHAAIKAWTDEAPALSCNCAKWIKAMDQNGDAWCREHLDEIVEDLVREAAKRAHDWKTVPADPIGRIKGAAWRGALYVPCAGVLLRPFVQSMVIGAIKKSEQEITA